ncbi:MAG: hypothetical protein EBZ48_06600 [Proteobacteria bacterium]|nr:hypothetical protein [Pseudomonadota bacterium]
MSDVTLYYHKCNDCLTPFSSTERKVDVCDCNGSVSFMGVVQGDKYVKTEDRAPCDGRCTHASGPMCDCACNGANHGTGRLVSVVVKEGKVQAVGLSEQDIERAHKFRAFRDYAEKQYTDIYGKHIALLKSGQYVRGEIYTAAIKARDALDKIVALKVYEKRHKQLAEFIIANKNVKFDP